ncbi:murein L,D-transpeptidase family protein [Novosphingobium sp. 9]|uniref:L,D-transpeptidase family protein n=1 Tax=Novosphingobium sp. 9 TaxID=2025349 RepID=UPI0021B5F32D|nr:L,D-transpeptidase family protein [Novosphingobium sp. 9]
MARGGWLGTLLPALAAALLLPSAPLSAQDAPGDVEALPPITLIRVHKAERRMELVDVDGRVHVIEGLQLGGDLLGPKHFEGDQKTPEGQYTIDWGNPNSAYHLSLHVSYPSADDTAYAVGQGRSAGGMIMVHGQPNDLPGANSGVRAKGDWTDGCIALSNAQMDAVYRAVPDGTPIDILP